MRVNDLTEIRRLTESEYDESLALSQYAFQYEVPKDEIELRKEKMKRQELLGEFDGETLLSKLHLIPFEIFMGEKRLAMGGIAGVATWPEYRRNRSVSRLLMHSLQRMKDNGQTVSMLHPFSIGFYRRFGWELTAVLKKVFIETKDLHFMNEVNGQIRRFSKNDPFEIVNSIYETYAMKYNSMLKRDDYWWENHVYTSGYQTAVYFDEAGAPTGYILYKVKEQLIDVQEFIYLSNEARRGLWNFICQHDSMVEKAKIILPESDQLPFLLQNPNIKQELTSYFMARIVDVAGYLEQYQLVGSESAFAIRVTDTVAEWNNGLILVDKTGAKFYSLDAWEGLGFTIPVLETNIQSLTAMFFGAQRPQFLYQSELVVGPESAAESLEAWMPRTQSTFLDFF
jgi:predicted acetyltransferase